MAEEFRYSLTRICLRTGQLSLSQRMANIFPDSGALRAVDTLDGSEFELTVLAPRRVAGLGEFFRKHELGVNDTVRLHAHSDALIALTAAPRRAPRDEIAPEAVAELLDGLVSDTPRSEEEIRALHPALPAAFPVSEVLEADPRFERHGGRWVALREEVQEPVAQSSSAPGEPVGRIRRAAVTPYPRAVMFPGEAALNSKRPEPDLGLTKRAREALAGFGYRVEALAQGSLLARAELGRRQHTVLVKVLADAERLDWAALLARRREKGSDYLAVFGDHRDLHRLTAPADVAHATLWSWDGIARVRNLAETVLIGPFDLEPHFERGGMFGPGLQQFEDRVGSLSAERGALSTVITRLAGLRAPSVFVLDDLVEPELSRERVAEVLECLSRAPFHLVGRIDRGEYCLRHRVDDALLHLSEYALSLRERLPRERRERLSGMAADDPAHEAGLAGQPREVPEDSSA